MMNEKETRRDRLYQDITNHKAYILSHKRVWDAYNEACLRENAAHIKWRRMNLCKDFYYRVSYFLILMLVLVAGVCVYQVMGWNVPVIHEYMTFFRIEIAPVVVLFCALMVYRFFMSRFMRRECNRCFDVHAVALEEKKLCAKEVVYCYNQYHGSRIIPLSCSDPSVIEHIERIFEDTNGGTSMQYLCDQAVARQNNDTMISNLEYLKTVKIGGFLFKQ